MATGPGLANASIGIVNIGQIAIRVKDLERAVAFYRDTLGLKFLFSAPPKLAFFDCGGVRLMLSPAEAPEFDHPGSILYFRVPDIQAACARLEQQSVNLRSQPRMIARMPDHDLWLADFQDSEDNVLALMSEVPGK
jgi:methylmalonyl-CoA/ethylmalonyl-CoA epimerase